MNLQEAFLYIEELEENQNRYAEQLQAAHEEIDAVCEAMELIEDHLVLEAGQRAQRDYELDRARKYIEELKAEIDSLHATLRAYHQ